MAADGCSLTQEDIDECARNNVSDVDAALAALSALPRPASNDL